MLYQFDHVKYVKLCAMWSYVKLCEAMWSYVKLCEAMWSYVKLCEAMWSWCLMIFVNFWTWGKDNSLSTSTSCCLAIEACRDRSPQMSPVTATRSWDFAWFCHTLTHCILTIPNIFRHFCAASSSTPASCCLINKNSFALMPWCPDALMPWCPLTRLVRKGQTGQNMPRLSIFCPPSTWRFSTDSCGANCAGVASSHVLWTPQWIRNQKWYEMIRKLQLSIAKAWLWQEQSSVCDVAHTLSTSHGR